MNASTTSHKPIGTKGYAFETFSQQFVDAIVIETPANLAELGYVSVTVKTAMGIFNTAVKVEDFI